MHSQWQAYLPPYVTLDLASHPDKSPVGRERRFPVVALFADIAGFTALSEALGNAGRNGTEQLTSILNRCFTPLITIIHQHGGMISSFGGDALTVLWQIAAGENEITSHRAIQCALQLQAAMREFAALQTGEPLTLQIGLAAGDVVYTTVGDPAVRTVAVVGGAVLFACAEAERMADAGEVVVHCPSLPLAESVRFTPINATFARVSGLIQAVETTPLVLPTLLAASLQRLATYLHPSIAEQLRGNQASFINERRNVTVVFVHFDHFDYDADPQVGGKLQHYFADVLRVIERYGGYLNKVDIGDKGSTYLVLFGAPLAYENDVERASHCALELRDLPTAEARIGINTGFVFCGLIGSAVRQEYTVIGDVVNLASRLMQTADAGQILLARATHEALGSAFLTAPLPAMKVKGKTEAVELFELTGLRQAVVRGQEPTYSLPIVGREAELSVIADRIAQIKRGHGQVIGITGEAGMGKSRLVAEVRRLGRANRLAVYGGECVSYGTNISYLLWHNLWRSFFNVDPAWPLGLQIVQLRAQLALIDERLLEWMPLLSNALRLPISDEALALLLDVKSRKILLESLLVDCLLYRANEAPILLVLEDCHWIDPLSQDLLNRIAESIADAPVLLVLLYRPPTSTDDALLLRRLSALPYWTELPLVEFTLCQTEELIRLKFGQLLGNAVPLPEPLVQRIAERAQGNPFYIEELINLLADQKLDPTDMASLAALDLPDSLHRLIISRIDQLEEGPKNTLKVASVIGRLFKANWLWGAYPQLGATQQIKTHLTTLSNLDLTPLDRSDPELEYLFKHVVTQEVAYQSLPFATRATLHEQIGSYLETTYGEEAAIDLLAHHYGLSANTAKQREYFRRAADAAAARYANDAAINYYRQLLPLLDDAGKIPIMFALGDIWKLLGAWDTTEALYRQMLELAAELNDPAAAGQAWSEIGDVQSSRGLHQEALISSAQAEHFALQAASLLLQVRVLLRKGWILSYCGQIREALDVSNRAIALSTTLEDERLLAFSLKLHGYMHVLLGQTAQADASFNQALAIHRRLDDREDVGRILNVLGENARMRGDYAQAVEHYHAALLIGRELRHPERIIMYLSNLGGALVGTGEYRRAITALREAINLAQTATWYGLSESNRFLAEAYLGLGNYTEALQAAYSGLALARATQLVLEVGCNLRVLGMILPHLPPNTPLPEPLLAHDCFAEALSIHTSIGAEGEQARTLREWGRYDLHHGEKSHGLAQLARARALFLRLGMTAELALMDED